MDPTRDGAVRVLFVCTANICRSAFAHVLTENLTDSVVVSSGGTHGWVGRSVEERMAAQLAERGFGVDGFVSRQVTDADVADADVVLTMEQRHRQFLLDSSPASVWKIFTLGQFARIVQGAPLGQTGLGLLNGLRQIHQPSLPEDDVADPYGRGDEAAEAAAERIEGLLQAILPRLVDSPAAAPEA